MLAMILEEQGRPLVRQEVAMPEPGAGEVLLRVTACGVCRTDLHVADGDLRQPHLPLILGHEIVGYVVATGPQAEGIAAGQRLGVPWLGGTCGRCSYCAGGMENLCDSPVFTGYQKDGGYARFATADWRYCFPVADGYTDEQAAPLLCAGLIGWRAFKVATTMAAKTERLGLWGFGAAAHILAQIASHKGIEVFAFTRDGDRAAQELALSLGATWAGGSSQTAPVALDASIIFAPVGALVPAALKSVRKGGVVVTGGIHMSDIPSFPYEILWGERKVVSVANLTREDGRELMALAGQMRIDTRVTSYTLSQANEALADLRQGRLSGAAVILPWN